MTMLDDELWKSSRLGNDQMADELVWKRCSVDGQTQTLKTKHGGCDSLQRSLWKTTRMNFA